MKYLATSVLCAAWALAGLAPAVANELKLSFNSDWPPYSVGVGADVHGILPELMREIIEKRMGIRLSNTGAPWKRAQAMVKKGSQDGFVTVATEKRLAFANSSENVVYTLEMRPLVKRQGGAFDKLTRKSGLDTVRTLRVCDILGNGWAERYYAKNKIDYVTASKVRACLRMVEKGRVDVVIQPAATLAAEVKAANLGEELVVMPHVFAQMGFTLLISKESGFNEEFLNKFDATVKAMKEDGSYRKLIDRLRGIDSRPEK